MKKTIVLYVSFIAAAVVAFFILKAALNPVIVTGSSMYPTYKSGDIVYGKRMIEAPSKGDVVVARSGGSKIIKRVIGTPGDDLVIKEGKLYVNNKEKTFDESIEDAGILKTIVTLNEDEYFLMGDNVNNSADSRRVGPFNIKDILYLVESKGE